MTPKPVNKAPPKKSPPRKQPAKSPPKKPPPTAAQVIHPGERLPYPPLTHKGGGHLTGGHFVTMQAGKVRLQVTAMLGADGMKITGGLGEWEEVRIPRGDPWSHWKGRQLYTASLNVIFDGWGKTTRSVEPQLKTLENLSTRIPGTLTPPNVRIWGPIPKWGLTWVITSTDYGDCIRDPKTGQRVRQECTIQLLEFRDESQAVTTRAAALPRPPQKYKVKAGDTLKTIAAHFLGNSNKWQVIAKANKGLRGWQIPKSFIGKSIVVPPK